MTLLLGAITRRAVVLAADGLEFLHSPGAPKREALSNRRKLLPLDERRIVLGVHGQNRLARTGEGLESQRLVIEMLPELVSQLPPSGEVAETARALQELLVTDVLHTFKELMRVGIHPAPLGILVTGFGTNATSPECYEAWWPLLGQQDQPRIIQHPENRQIPAVIHSGDGTRYVTKVIRVHGGRYNVDQLKNATIKKTQGYVRALYRKAESRQPRDSREFGGMYHEITVTAEGCSWTVPPETAS